MQAREIEELLASEDVVSMGKQYLKMGRYQNAIQYLESKGDTKDIEIAHMLSQAYKKLNTNQAKIFFYLKIVRTEAKNNFLANPTSLTLRTNSGHLFLSTLNDMILSAPTHGLSKVLFDEGIDTIKTHPLTFHGKLKLQFLNTLYHNNGVTLRKFAGKLTEEELPLRKELLEKSIDSFKEALKIQADDIQTVLYIASGFVELDTEAQRGLDFLLSFQKTFEKNPCYHYALYVLFILKNNGKASKKHHDLYKKFSSFVHDKGLLTLFNALLPDTVSPIGRAISKFNNKQYAEAKKLVDVILVENPNNMEAIELSAEIEIFVNNTSNALMLAEKILSKNPNSNIGLKVKACCLWQTRDFESRKTATAICEDLYKKGYQTNFVLNILVSGFAVQKQHDKVIYYGSILAATTPSAYIYYTLGLTYFGLSDYENAFLYLKKLYKEYSSFEPTDVLETMITSRFFMAKSKNGLKKCGKLIATYLDLMGDNEPNLGITLIIKELQNANIYIPSSKLHEEEVPETKSDDNDNVSYFVPPEIKAYILDAMSKKSYGNDSDLPDKSEAVDSDDDFDRELEELKSADLKPIGTSGRLFCFLSKRARTQLSSIELNKCETVLENKVLLKEKSKNTSGHKMLDRQGHKYKIKTMGSGMRVHGRSRFFKDGLPRLLVPEGGSIVRYKDVVRNHKKSCKT